MLMYGNSTAVPTPDTNTTVVSTVFGYLGLVVGGFAFGTASLPIKRCEPGDGALFQLTSALALWSIGLIIQMIRSYPRFFFLPMIGGFFFATANAKMVPILKTIGIGLGTSIRASIGIIVGWADARFGLFGIKPEPPANLVENYIGVSILLIGAVLFLVVRSGGTSPNQAEEQIKNETEPLLSDGIVIRNGYDPIDPNDVPDEGQYFLQGLSPRAKRLLGVGLSITAGICVGFTYAPYLYVIDRYENVSRNGLDYVFSMFTGALFSSFVFFLIYCLAKKNRPYVNSKSILYGCANGWIWGIGVCCFQYANSILSQAVTFPIACGLQSLVGVLYGLFLFKEITGRKNLIILGIGFAATIIGSTLVGVSKY